MPKTLKVAINGFGRIGRLFYRNALLHPTNFEVVAVNNPGWTEEMYHHLFKYDTVYGIFDKRPQAKLLNFADPTELPWREMKIDVVIESSGRFTAREDASKHLQAGAKKVLISAPSEDCDVTLVLGVNEKDYDAKKHQIISMASCTTNCLAPIVKILQEHFGIQKGFMSTVHSYTADQNLQDGSHKDLRRARAAAQNIVPTKTGAAKAIFKVVRGLEDKMHGIAIRVPSPTGSMIDLTCLLEKNTDAEKINKLFENYMTGEMKKVLEITYDPIVSSDIIGNEHSAIVDGLLTKVLGGNLVEIVAWYDNEWAYARRLVDMVNYFSQQE